MNHRVDRQEMIDLFQGIASSFPRLVSHLELDHPHVDLLMDFPEQEGLKFSVSINLQGDELYLSAGVFRIGYLPCTDPDVVKRFETAVHGLLSGSYRILEHYRGKRPFKAELQRPESGGWVTIGTWYTMRFPFPWRTHTRVLINT